MPAMRVTKRSWRAGSRLRKRSPGCWKLFSCSAWNKHAYFCTQFCLAWATPGPIQHIVIEMSCLPCHPMAPQDTEAALALLHDSMSTQQCLHNEKGTCCRRTLLRTRTAQGGHRAACLAHCRLLMFGVSCVSLSAKKAPKHRRAPAHLADDGLLPTP